MISWKIKQKIIDEIIKFGNIYSACLKVGVSRANYYRWKEKDKKFKIEADKAEQLGRENMCDIAEGMLINNVKKGEQRAIEYCLRFNSERYRQKPTSNVVILHKKSTMASKIQNVTLEDLIDDFDTEINRTEDSESEKEIFAKEPQENQKTPNIEGLNSASQDKMLGSNT